MFNFFKKQQQENSIKVLVSSEREKPFTIYVNYINNLMKHEFPNFELRFPTSNILDYYTIEAKGNKNVLNRFKAVADLSEDLTTIDDNVKYYLKTLS